MSLTTAIARARQKGSKGFSLIEVMVALVISGIVLVGVFAFSGVTRATNQNFRRDVRIQQALEGAMYTVGNDVRVAGLGFGQFCDEVRIWDDNSGRVINPGSHPAPVIAGGQASRDFVTGEPFWVLRDGLQAHWRSSANVMSGNSASMLGNAANPTSAHPENQADSFDVAFGEAGFVGGLGAFTLEQAPGGSGPGAELRILVGRNGANGIPAGNSEIDLVRAYFPPGGFVLVAPSSGGGSVPALRQCILMQVTADVEPNGGSGDFSRWRVFVGDQSGFNRNIGALFQQPGSNWVTSGSPDVNDFLAVTDPAEEPMVIPLGNFRWSRYEIDYSVPTRPYLVRSDIIGWGPADPIATPNGQYPSCVTSSGGGVDCQLPQLHVRLANGGTPQNGPPPRIPIAPMIEDMQVAVGCDGYDVGSYVLPDDSLPARPGIGGNLTSLPDSNLGVGGLANQRIDEFVQPNRDRDEWLGNALVEGPTPDCVMWGTGQIDELAWQTSHLTENFNTGAYKMSPQIVRVTLLGKSETEAGTSSRFNNGNSGNLANNQFNFLYSIEDRATLPPQVRGREYHTVTEQFRLRNTKWRDPLRN